MRLFPIVERELRVASRKRATYWNRASVALAAMLVATFALVMFHRGAPGEAGIMLFVSMSVISFLHCLLMGFVLTSDSIAEEKREGTLGLLFLTDLKGYDVVFGKLVVSSLRGVYGLLAIFPILSICFLLGGVTGVEFTRVMMVCFNILLLSLSLGMLASAICSDERKALALAGLVLLLLTAGCPALGGWVSSTTRWQYHPVSIFAPSPGYAAFHAFAATYKPDRFATAMIVQASMSVLALMAACILVPRSWQQRTQSAAGAKRGLAWRDLAAGPRAMRDEFRRALLNINPYYWLTSRDRMKQTLPWLWLSAAGIIWVIALFEAPSWREEPAYILSAFILHGLLKLWVALEGSRQLGADRKSGALELLLCTPFKVSSIVTGQWMSLLRQFLFPALAVLLADVIFMIGGMPHSNRDEWVSVWLVGMSIFILDLAALAFLSMWLGFNNRRTGQGGVHAIIWVCSVPWILFAGSMAMLAILDEFRIIRINKIDDFLLFYWWLISVVVGVASIVYARRRLHRDLRAIAAERHVGRAALLGRALGLWYARLQSPPPPGVPPKIGSSF